MTPGVFNVWFSANWNDITDKAVGGAFEDWGKANGGIKVEWQSIPGSPQLLAKQSADGNEMIQLALKQATSIPLSVAEKAHAVAQIVEQLKPITNPNMKSDLTTATALAHAATTGALANVEINLESLSDLNFVAEVRQKASSFSVPSMVRP